MPTEQDLDTMQNELIGLAQAVEASVILGAEKQIALENAKSVKEQIGANLLASIAAQTLVYRNDDQRKAAWIEAKVLSVDYQTARTAYQEAITEKAQIDAEIEMHRKTYRAKELLFLYYANHS